jgi:hypothetical protein
LWNLEIKEGRSIFLNPKVEKITAEIEKIRRKISNYQTRLRDLERQKVELENADIIAMVRGVDIPPDEFATFVQMFKAQQDDGGTVPELTAAADGEPQKDKEEEPIEN